MPDDAVIVILNEKALRLTGCPATVVVGEEVTITAEMRFRLRNTHGAALPVKVFAYIAVAGEQPQWEECPQIQAPTGDMQTVEERSYQRTLRFANPGPVILESACRLEWIVGGETQSEERYAGCSFAVVPRPSNPYLGTRLDARNK